MRNISTNDNFHSKHKSLFYLNKNVAAYLLSIYFTTIKTGNFSCLSAYSFSFCYTYFTYFIINILVIK